MRSNMWRPGTQRRFSFLIFIVAIVCKSSCACSQIDNCDDCHSDQGPYRCKTCTEGYYKSGEDTCSSCPSNCVTCVSMNNCSGCVAGYHGNWCSVQCDTNCTQPAVCEQYSGTCEHGCRYGYFQAGYKCLRCSEYIPICDECTNSYYCTRCASGYNVWSSGDTSYCNVGCPPGTWGETCQYNCSSNCSKTGCNETNGFCHNCIKYTYGQTCQFRCREGCYNGSVTNVCGRMTGQCIYGCKPGYTGAYCEILEASVDGQWSQWSDYSQCSVTCGWGSESRTRSCDQPAPQKGGQPCSGSDVEMTNCTIANCQDGGQWGQWSEYTAYSATRSRSCAQPAPNNGGCVGNRTETIYLNPNTRCVKAESDSVVGVVTGGVFGGIVFGFVGGLVVGYCIKNDICWRRSQKSGKRDNTNSPPSVAYVNITDAAGSVTMSGDESSVPAYESLEQRSRPDTI